MHTRKKARHGGHAVPGNKHTVPVGWQLVLWLGVVVLAVGLVVLAPEARDEIDGLAPTGWTGSKGPTTRENTAASYASAAPLGATSAANCADLQVGPGPTSPPSRAYATH